MQYSIRHLMGWTVAVAIACAVLFAVPAMVGAVIMGLVLLWLPVLLICGVIYARNWRRTFFIGATIAAAPFLVPFLFYVPIVLVSGGLADIDWSEFASGAEGFAFTKFAIAAFFMYVAFSGVAAILSRWLVSPREVQKSARTPVVSVPRYTVLHGRLVTENLPPSN